jgi:hypothetical protein
MIYLNLRKNTQTPLLHLMDSWTTSTNHMVVQPPPSSSTPMADYSIPAELLGNKSIISQKGHSWTLYKHKKPKKPEKK